MCCHHSDRSWRSLLVREVEMSINIPRLTTTVSMLHEGCTLLWMAPSWGVYMVCVRPWRTRWTVMDTTVLGRHFRVLRRRAWCVNHDTVHCWGNVLIHHTRNMNFTTAAAWLSIALLTLWCDFLFSTGTVGGATWFLSTFRRWRRYFDLEMGKYSCYLKIPKIPPYPKTTLLLQISELQYTSFIPMTILQLE